MREPSCNSKRWRGFGLGNSRIDGNTGSGEDTEQRAAQRLSSGAKSRSDDQAADHAGD